MPRTSNALSLSHQVLRILIRLNLIGGALILSLLIAGIISKTAVFAALGLGSISTNDSFMLGARSIMLGGVIGVLLVNVILRRLTAIVDTVREGDPFIHDNADRLKRIAWAVLGLEVLHTTIVLTARSISTPMMPIDIRWSFNFTRWVVVLMLFVLARVFEQGTQMREDLEGTV